MKKLALVLLILASASAAGAAVKFVTSYRAPGVPAIALSGQKVAAVFFSQDTNARVSVEEALARQLTAIGVTGVASYRFVPKEAAGNKDLARDFFQRAGIKGVVALRVLGVDEQKSWEPSMWIGSSYSSWWDYWGHGWGPGMGYGYGPGYGVSVGVGSGSIRTDVTFSVEAMVFGVETGQLGWAGMSETTNPKDAERFIKDLVGAMVKAMQSRGLIQK